MNEPDAQTRALLDRLQALSGGVRADMREIPITAVREGARQTWLALSGPDSARCETQSIEIPRFRESAGPPLAARLYRPIVKHGPLPLVVYFHGGGWVMGDLDSYQPLVKALCAASGSAFVSVDYRLAPENPFPAGLEDAQHAVEWALEQADRLGCRADRLAVAGDSAGGNLAAVVAWRLGRKRPGLLSGQFLIYPMLDVAADHAKYSSRMAYGAGEYLLANSDIDAVTAWYLPDCVRRDDPCVSPMFASAPEVFPPTVMVSAGLDPLTSEAEVYAHRLRRAGVACRHKHFETTIHAFMSFGDLEVAQRGRRWLALRISEMLA